MKIVLKFIPVACFLFFCLHATAGEKIITTGPDIIVKGAYFFTLNEAAKKVYFDLEIQNIGNQDAVIDSLAYNCSLYDGKQNGIIWPAGGKRLTNVRFVLEKGKSVKFKGVWFTYGNLELKNFQYLYIKLQPSGLAEDNITNNKYLTRHLYPRQPSDDATNQVPQDHPPVLAPPELYPDLQLSVSNISSKIETNTQTGVRYRLFTFKCTIKNISNYVVPLDTIRRLSIQSYRVNTCSGQNLEPAGGRRIAEDITEIRPGQSIVVEHETANQPIIATTKIRVELKYRGTESNLANNKACISQ